MSKRFWGTVMVIATLLTAGSSYLMLNRLSEAESQPQPVPLRQVPADEAPPMPSVDTSTPTVDVPVPAEETKAAPAPAKATGAKRNILFKLARPTAKKVEIIGDFNKWLREPMKKSGKVWQISVPLTPGSYEYAFVVDDKRVRDPNNKQSGSGGKSSILTVKPLAAQK